MHGLGRADEARATPLPVTIDHAVAAGSLPLHHRDPFDRTLIAQAQVEGFTLVTADPRILKYGVPAIDAGNSGSARRHFFAGARRLSSSPQFSTTLERAEIRVRELRDDARDRPRSSHPRRAARKLHRDRGGCRDRVTRGATRFSGAVLCHQGKRRSRYNGVVITSGIREFMSRDWRAVREAKDAYWGERILRLGPMEGLRVGDELRRQVLAQDANWPRPADRREDLLAHVRLSECFRRAGSTRRR